MTNGNRKSAVRKQPAKAGKGAYRQLTCFVVTGFGNKTDIARGKPIKSIEVNYKIEYS